MSMTPTEFIVPKPNKVKSAAEARDLAIDYQEWFSVHTMSYGEAAYYSNYFEILAQRFPELTDEFKENAII